MKASESANKLKELIARAIEDHVITKSEYDMIISQATEDMHIDPQERALLMELRDMIEEKTIKLVP